MDEARTRDDRARVEHGAPDDAAGQAPGGNGAGLRSGGVSDPELDSQPGLSRRSMVSIQLNLVYQYRRLAVQRAQGKPLSAEELTRLQTIQSLFSASAPDPADSDTPSFRKLDQMSAVMRASQLDEPVRVAALDLEQAVCLCAAEVELAEGAEIELIFDDEAGCGSYRFKARVAWSRVEAGNQQILGLELCGVPLLLRRGPPSNKTNSIIERLLQAPAGRSRGRDQ